MTDPVLSMYGLDESNCSVTAFGNGLINHTWKIACEGKDFLLQKINQQVFKTPEDIMYNFRLLSEYFKYHYPGYLFVAPLQTTQGNDPPNATFWKQISSNNTAFLGNWNTNASNEQ